MVVAPLNAAQQRLGHLGERSRAMHDDTPWNSNVRLGGDFSAWRQPLVRLVSQQWCCGLASAAARLQLPCVAAAATPALPANRHTCLVSAEELTAQGRIHCLAQRRLGLHLCGVAGRVCVRARRAFP